MGLSSQTRIPEGSDTGSGCLLEMPFEAYTDSLETEDDMNISNTRVDSIPHGDLVGPYFFGAWHRTLEILFPPFALHRKNEVQDKYDTLPLLPESPPQVKRKIHRTRWSRWLWRGVIGFFVMLYVQTKS